MKTMSGWIVVALVVVSGLAVAGFGQVGRGKAELSAPGGSVTVEYGRPSLKGRDMLGMLKEGDFWRMGANQATVLTTPVPLAFGSTRIPAGSYTLRLKREAGDRFSLVMNSQPGQAGSTHDSSKEIASIPLKNEAVSAPVETFTIDLKGAPGGGTFVMTWGTTGLSAGFKFGS